MGSYQVFQEGYVAKFTNLKSELVNDRVRPDTFADYVEKVQWARNSDVDQQRQEAPDLELIYDTETEVKQDSFTKEELNEAISRLKSNKTPGPNGVTSEVIKLLSEEARENCWNY